MSERHVLAVIALFIGIGMLGGCARLGRSFADEQRSVGSPERRDWWDRFVRSRPPWEQKMLSHPVRRRFNALWFGLVGLMFIYIGVRGFTG